MHNTQSSCEAGILLCDLFIIFIMRFHCCILDSSWRYGVSLTNLYRVLQRLRLLHSDSFKPKLESYISGHSIPPMSDRQRSLHILQWYWRQYFSLLPLSVSVSPVETDEFHSVGSITYSLHRVMHEALLLFLLSSRMLLFSTWFLLSNC